MKCVNKNNIVYKKLNIILENDVTSERVFRWINNNLSASDEVINTMLNLINFNEYTAVRKFINSQENLDDLLTLTSENKEFIKNNLNFYKNNTEKILELHDKLVSQKSFQHEKHVIRKFESSLDEEFNTTDKPVADEMQDNFKDELKSDEDLQKEAERISKEKLLKKVEPEIRKMQERLWRLHITARKKQQGSDFENEILNLRKMLQNPDILQGYEMAIATSTQYLTRIKTEFDELNNKIKNGHVTDFAYTFSKFENIRIWLKAYSNISKIETILKMNIDYEQQCLDFLKNEFFKLNIPLEEIDETINFIRWIDGKYDVNIGAQLKKYGGSDTNLLGLKNEMNNLLISLEMNQLVDGKPLEIDKEAFINNFEKSIITNETSIFRNTRYVLQQNNKLLAQFQKAMEELAVEFIYKHNETHNKEMLKKGHNVWSKEDIRKELGTLSNDLKSFAATLGVPRESGDIIVDTVGNYFVKILHQIHLETIDYNNEIAKLYNKYVPNAKSNPDDFYKQFLKIATVKQQRDKKDANGKYVLDDKGKRIKELQDIKFWVFQQEYNEYEFESNLQEFIFNQNAIAEEEYLKRHKKVLDDLEIINNFLSRSDDFIKLENESIEFSKRDLSLEDKEILEDIFERKFEKHGSVLYKALIAEQIDLEKQLVLMGSDRDDYIGRMKNINYHNFYNENTIRLNKTERNKLILDKFKSLPRGEYEKWYANNTREMKFTSSKATIKFIMNNRDSIAFNKNSLNDKKLQEIDDIYKDYNDSSNDRKIELETKLLKIYEQSISETVEKGVDNLLNSDKMFFIRVYKGDFIKLSDKYKNTSEEFNKIKNHEMYKFLIQSYNKYNDRLPKGLSYGMIPQFYKHSTPFYDTKKSMGDNIIDKKNEIKKSITVDYSNRQIEQEINYNSTDIDGEVINNIPVQGLAKIDDIDDVNINLTEVMGLFQATTNKFLTLKNNEDIYKIFKTLLQGDKMLGIEPRKALFRNALNHTEYDNPKTKTLRTNNITKNLEGFIKFMDNSLYGIDEEDSTFTIGKTVYDTNKVVKKMMKYGSITMLAMNINASVENVAIGNLGMLKEAIGGKNYTKKELSKAHGVFSKYLANPNGLLKDISNVDIYKKSMLTQLVIMHDMIQGQYSDHRGIKHERNLAQKIFNTDVLFFNQHAAEFQIQITGGIAQMLHRKISLPEGKVYNSKLNKIEDATKEQLIKWESVKNQLNYKYNKTLKLYEEKLNNEVDAVKKEKIKADIELAKKNLQIELEESNIFNFNYFDFWEQDKDGTLQVKEILKPYYSFDVNNEMKESIHSHNKRIHGNYSKIDKSSLEYKWWGQLAMMFKKHLYPGLQHRWGKKKENFIIHDVEEGYWITTLKKIYEDYNNYGNYAFQKLFDGTATENEKVAIKKVITDLSVLGSLSIAFMLTQAIADDDDDTLAFLRLHLKRIYDSEALWTGILSPNAVMRTFRSPTVMMNIYDRWGTFLAVLLTDPFGTYAHGTAYNDKGDSKLGAAFIKALPIIRPIQNLLNPEEVLKFYTQGVRI